MKLLRTGMTAVALAAVACGGVQATPLFVGGGNELIYNNFETPYRLTTECSAAFPCFAFVAGQDPTDANGKNWQQVDGRVPGNLMAGDVFVGILRASSNNEGINGAGGAVWVPGLKSDIFTGYFVQQIKSIDTATFPINYLSLGTAAIDPFGVLNTAGGDMFALYADGTTGLKATGSILNNISIAVGLNGGALVAGGNAGTLWGTVGIGANSANGSQGYAYTQTNFNLGSGSGNADESIAHMALDILSRGPTYSAGSLNKLNDNIDNNVGGSIADTTELLCSAADILASTTFAPGTPSTAGGNTGVACTDLIVTTRIDPNLSFQIGDNTVSTTKSSWQFKSFDPVQLNRIPEPGSLALMGAALAGLAVVRRRKSA